MLSLFAMGRIDFAFESRNENVWSSCSAAWKLSSIPDAYSFSRRPSMSGSFRYRPAWEPRLTHL
jgi:hypothetical protein